MKMTENPLSSQITPRSYVHYLNFPSPLVLGPGEVYFICVVLYFYTFLVWLRNLLLISLFAFKEKVRGNKSFMTLEWSAISDELRRSLQISADRIDQSAKSNRPIEMGIQQTNWDMWIGVSLVPFGAAGESGKKMQKISKKIPTT